MRYSLRSIGPYKNSSFLPGQETSENLYREEYILVVRESSVSLLDYLRIPFAPLNYKVVSCFMRYFILMC